MVLPLLSYHASIDMILVSLQKFRSVKTLVIKLLHQGSRSWASVVLNVIIMPLWLTAPSFPSPPTLPDMSALILRSTVLPGLLLFSLSFPL